MAVACTDTTVSLDRDAIHTYTWRDSAVTARRVVVLIHGLMMHGKSFEKLAFHLASLGAVAVAPDLRGFGRWYFGPESQKDKTSFARSQDDLTKLIHLLKDEHPNLPLFLAGESLGAHFARRIVSLHPELVSGLILSSPCVRPRLVSLPLIPHACSQLVLAGLSPERELDLSPFARKFLKDEPENLQQYLDDPMSRKSLDVLELIDSLRMVGSMEMECISPEIPILVLRGKNDGICKSSSVNKFVDSLKSDNLTVHRCNGCGHLILQATKIDGEIMEAIDGWLDAIKGASMS